MSLGQDSHGGNTCVNEVFNTPRLTMSMFPDDISPGKVGIITPYQQQLSLLRERFRRVLGQNIAQGIEFNTVDGFQGREVDILIFSTVRATSRNGQSSSRIGFVADVRRMNVALTRARFSLWIVCNAATLQASPPWAALLQNAKERQLLHQAKSPYGNFFEKGCFDETRQQVECSLERLSLMASDGINSRVVQGKANIESGKCSIHKGSLNVDRPFETNDFSENSLNKAVKGVNSRDYAIEGKNILKECSFQKKARSNENIGMEGDNQNTYETCRDKLLFEPAAISLEAKNCNFQKQSETLSVVNRSKESKFQARSNRSVVQGQPLDCRMLEEADERHGHQEGSASSKPDTGVTDKSFMKSSNLHITAATNNPMQIVERKQSQVFMSVREDKDSKGASNAGSKITGPKIDKTKTGAGEVGATRLESRESQGVSSDLRARAVSTGQIVVDNKMNNMPLDGCAKANDIERELNISRPSKRIRHDKVAGESHTIKRNPSGDVQKCDVKNHADKLASSSAGLLKEEWIRFLQVLKDSKIRFPLS
ncbi:hypothetical protein L7F22_065257 [Adiantum nelumboides]|nr:hypothetical protein [Adiantum nelumboides]